jgi:hypothetical protein
VLGVGGVVKGDWLVISVLAFAFALMCALAGADWMLWLLHTIARWLTAWPPPEEHFASMIGDLGWPLAVLFIVWLLRRPIGRAAYLLAERMKSDAVEIPGFLKINAASFNPLDAQLAVQHVKVAPVAADVDATESLLEYAGVSEENAQRLRRWIADRHGASLDPEAFMTEDHFANARHQAYIELVQGNG